MTAKIELTVIVRIVKRKKRFFGVRKVVVCLYNFVSLSLKKIFELVAGGFFIDIIIPKNTKK